jgi:hypothetical protein
MAQPPRLEKAGNAFCAQPSAAAIGQKKSTNPINPFVLFYAVCGCCYFFGAAVLSDDVSPAFLGVFFLLDFFVEVDFLPLSVLGVVFCAGVCVGAVVCAIAGIDSANAISAAKIVVVSFFMVSLPGFHYCHRSSCNSMTSVSWGN